jgi:hypothetical protein
MRSPYRHSSHSPQRRLEPQYENQEQRQPENDDACTSSTASTKNRKSCIPQPRASLSSFAAPSWNKGAIGEHNSNVRVVARIRPLDSNPESSMKEDAKEAIFAIANNKNDDNIDEVTNMVFSPIMRSPPPRSSVNEGVADIAARFNTNPSSPIAPNMPAMITTPTKFMQNKSPSRFIRDGGESKMETPIHTNVNSSQQRQTQKNGILLPDSTRQSFIQAPSSPSFPAANHTNHNTKPATHQTIAAGVTDPKQFNFDAVSNMKRNIKFTSSGSFCPSSSSNANTFLY